MEKIIDNAKGMEKQPKRIKDHSKEEGTQPRWR
jgi:hypothetical protein